MAKKSQFRKKRSDSLVGNIEKQYGVDFGVKSNMKLGNYLRQKGYPSLSKAVKAAESK